MNDRAAAMQRLGMLFIEDSMEYSMARDAKIGKQQRRIATLKKHKKALQKECAELKECLMHREFSEPTAAATASPNPPGGEGATKLAICEALTI